MIHLFLTLGQSVSLARSQSGKYLLSVREVPPHFAKFHRIYPGLRRTYITSNNDGVSFHRRHPVTGDKKYYGVDDDPRLVR